MRIVVVGGTGLIGSAVAARLVAGGHEVTSIARRTVGSASSLPGGVRLVTADIARMSDADWRRVLIGNDAVVNCAGILQDAPGESTRSVHQDAVGALVRACGVAGVRRLVHFSAIGVDRGPVSAFSATKAAGESAVRSSGLEWVILRPSVVLGRQAYGASAAFRGLASLPVMPVLPQAGMLQVVQLDDVVSTVEALLAPSAPSRVELDLAGPEPLRFAEIVEHYRAWLGWDRARQIRVPDWLVGLSYAAGDFVGWLGWRSPLRSNARLELPRGALADPKPWSEATGISPRSLAAALAAEPAGVQERWFAALYFLKPLLFVALALFWIGTGLISVGPGYGIGISLMQEGGAGWLSGPSVIAGGLADLAIGLGIAVRRTARPALWAGVAISLFYAAMGTWLLPRLWIDPLGPMLKIWPIIALLLVAIAILRDR